VIAEIQLPYGVLISYAGARKVVDVYDDLFHQVMISQPKVHVFGHIHGGYGKTQFGEGPIFVNAAICDEGYRPVNAPVVVEL